VKSAFGQSEVRRSDCARAFGRNLASGAEKMFSLLISFIQTFYLSCTSNTIFKDNAEVPVLGLLFNARKVIPVKLTHRSTEAIIIIIIIIGRPTLAKNE
jgi:hypothetical protein